MFSMAAVMLVYDTVTARPGLGGDLEQRITCGGNYGWFSEEPWAGRPCPPPLWEPVWELNRSTTPWTPWGPLIAEGNRPSFVDPANASRWGWVTFDWSDANSIWQNRFPHMNEEILVQQCAMVKARRTGTKCMVYRNTELALQWQETSAKVMKKEYADRGWFLRFKTQALCDAAPPCDIAAYHNIANNSAPLVPCNKSAPVSAPNCAFCCNFSRVYNNPIGGSWPPGPLPPHTRFGNNALNDGQFFWDFRNPSVRDYFSQAVMLNGSLHDEVDGIFTDDPGGYGQEHKAIQSVVQLTPEEIKELQLQTQRTWMQALHLLIAHKKYIPQAYRTTPPFQYNTTDAGIRACTEWMRVQCTTAPENSTQVYTSRSLILAEARMDVAAFLVSRGPYSFLGVTKSVIDLGNASDPLFRLYRLDTGHPVGSCTEGSGSDRGVFSRQWAGGKATVDCNTATGKLDFKFLDRADW